MKREIIKLKISINIFVFILLSLFMLVSFSSFSQEKELKKVVLKLKWDHKFQFAGYYAAKEKGFYEKRGLDVEIQELKEGENPVDTVISGEAQFGIGGSDLIVEKASGKDIMILAPIFQHSHLVLVTDKKSGIDNIHDIKDKSITLGPTSKELLVYLYNEGIDWRKLNIANKVTKGEGHDLRSFEVSSDSTLDRHNDFEIRIFNPRVSGMDFYGDSIFTSSKYMKRNIKIIDEFLNASFEGWDYALANRDEIVELIYTKYSAKRTKLELLSEAYEVDKLVMPQVVKIGYTNKNRWDFIAKEFKNAGLIEKRIDVDKFVFMKNIEIDTKKIINIGIALLVFLLMLLTINRYIIKLNKKLQKEMKQKNTLLTMITKSEEELREFLTIIEHIPISVVITDSSGIITYGNKASSETSGYSKEELIGKYPNIFKSGYHEDSYYREMWETITSGTEWHGEFKNMRKNKEVYWERTVIIPVKNEEDVIYSYLAIKEDITEKKKQMELLQVQAERDDLTGLYNRRYGIELLNREMENAKENHTTLFVCFIDLNKLKYVNDYFGHDYGDEMIKVFANTVSKELRERDTFFRLGGDEFVIIFTRCTLEIVEKVWDRIKEALDRENKAVERIYNISASHGVIQYEEKYKNVDEILSEADKKMYEEKKNMSEIRSEGK